ncbi:MAG TPA: AAA family ATPase [Thermoguttaceae bacterium]|nr:AAA family ATPase [Thermoguttaceae bacterium]
MAIQELSVFGFRSLKKVDWHPRQLNLLVGPNGSGKSNLIRCLELISQVAKGQLEKTVSDEGGIIPLLWDHQPGSCGWKMRIDPVDQPRDRIEDALTLEFELGQVGGGSGYEIAKDSLGNWQQFERREEKSPYWIFNRERRRAYLYDQQQAKLVPLEKESPENPDGYAENESLLCHIADQRNRIPTLTRRVLYGWNVHHDVHAERGAAMRKPATTQLTRKLEPDGSNLVTVLHTLYEGDRQFRNRIDEGMKAGFGDEYERLAFQPAAAQQIQLAVQWKSSSQPHAGADLSDGTLRFLFLLAVLSHPEPGALIAIDEPEVGLHPSMLPVVAEYAEEASQRTQVILTSHSPEFLDAFTELSPHVTLCHWEAGETRLYELDSQVLGRWLEQYRLGHLFTRGDLEALALPGVEPVEDFKERFKDLPSEDEALANLPADAQDNAPG